MRAFRINRTARKPESMPATEFTKIDETRAAAAISVVNAYAVATRAAGDRDSRLPRGWYPPRYRRYSPQSLSRYFDSSPGKARRRNATTIRVFRSFPGLGNDEFLFAQHRVVVLI